MPFQPQDVVLDTYSPRGSIDEEEEKKVPESLNKFNFAKEEVMMFEHK
jgi:hypothetical protein